MRTVTFLDTSVFTNILEVPGKCQHPEVGTEFANRVRSGEEFILPIAAVIETGNFIGQLKGDARRPIGEKFASVLQRMADGQAPWTMLETTWSGPFLHRLLKGSVVGADYLSLTAQGIGLGDMSILTELRDFREKNMIPAQLWTLDAALAAYANC